MLNFWSELVIVSFRDIRTSLEIGRLAEPGHMAHLCRSGSTLVALSYLMQAEMCMMKKIHITSLVVCLEVPLMAHVLGSSMGNKTIVVQ